VVDSSWVEDRIGEGSADVALVLVIPCLIWWNPPPSYSTTQSHTPSRLDN
jgi:hypothetical protein